MLKAFKNLAGGIASAVGGSPLSPRRDFLAAPYPDALYPDETIPRNPPGFSILDDDSPRGRGFLPLADAARTMGLTEDETLALCERELRAFRQGSTVYVQPAVVSILGSRRSEPASTPPEAA